MDKTSLDSNGTPLHQDPPTPRAAPTAAERVAAAEAIEAEMVADPEWQDKLPTESKWRFDNVSFEFTHPTVGTEVSVAPCPAQSVSPDLDNASPQMSFEFTYPGESLPPDVTATLPVIRSSFTVEFDAGNAVLPSDVRKILARNELDELKSRLKERTDEFGVGDELKAQADITSEPMTEVTGSSVTGNASVRTLAHKEWRYKTTPDEICSDWNDQSDA